MSYDRETLLKAINLVRPAVATQAYVPALAHIAFDGQYATAYNDITAISARCDLDADVCLPGDLLIKFLNNINTKEVKITVADTSSVVIESGRSKIKLAALPGGDFPFDFPADKDYSKIAVTQDMLDGIEQCLISVGTDPSHPAQMGITIEEGEGGAVLYSTDNYSISRYQSETKIKLEAGVPVILPTFFCERMLTLSKAFPDADIIIEIRPGSCVARFDDFAILFTKLVVNLEPLDFSRMIAKYLTDKEVRDFSNPIPDSFDSSFSRALLVLDDVRDKSTKVTLGDKEIKLLTVSSTGEVADVMEFKGKWTKSPDEPFWLDPSLVVRATKHCTHIVFFTRVAALTGCKGKFLHLISQVTSA